MAYNNAMDEKEKLIEAKKQRNHRTLNLCVLGFAFALSITALITFFVATFTDGNDNAYTIASTYILCMLLAAPTLKVFHDKTTSSTMKRLNVATITFIFLTILTLAVDTFIQLAIGH